MLQKVIKFAHILIWSVIISSPQFLVRIVLRLLFYFTLSSLSVLSAVNPTALLCDRPLLRLALTPGFSRSLRAVSAALRAVPSECWARPCCRRVLKRTNQCCSSLFGFFWGQGRS